MRSATSIVRIARCTKPRRCAYHAARQRRLTEALALHDHPWLREQQGRGRRYQAGTAAKHLARGANS